jgi:hypothetical protein
MPTSKLTNIAIVLLLVGIFFNRYIDLNPYLQIPKLNNFLDLRISILDLGVFFLLLAGLYKSFKSPKKSFLNILSFVVLFVPVLMHFSIPFVLETSRYWLVYF